MDRAEKILNFWSEEDLALGAGFQEPGDTTLVISMFAQV
jgi:hypothetical protein